MTGTLTSQNVRLGHDLPGVYLSPDAQRIRELVDAHDPLETMRRAAEQREQARDAALGATGLEALDDTYSLVS